MSDLISRKAVIKKIEGIYIQVTGIRSGKGILAEWMNKYRETVLSTIREEPTIEAVPVVHSEWKYYRKQGIAVCKNCSFERNVDDNFGRAIACPNCGADMRNGGVE